MSNSDKVTDSSRLLAAACADGSQLINWNNLKRAKTRMILADVAWFVLKETRSLTNRFVPSADGRVLWVEKRSQNDVEEKMVQQNCVVCLC